MKRKLKLTVTKISRRAVLQQNSDSVFCPVCKQKTEILDSKELDEFFEIENRLFKELIAAGKIHVIETAKGNLQICKKSLTGK